ncbi:MAG: hypothetical protein HC913_14210 [Microscillaceae bacterium]|nr:hypothetical protein [Microscillaceae bacterium]
MAKNTFIPCVGFFLLTSLFLPTLGQSFQGEVYWVYQKDDTDYRLKLEKAAQKGIQISNAQKHLTFRVQLNAREWEMLRQGDVRFPLHIEWYRYNRAKLSVFEVQTLEEKQTEKIKLEEKLYYRLSSTQVNILSGTWVVKVSDAKGQSISFNGQTEFDVIVL